MNGATGRLKWCMITLVLCTSCVPAKAQSRYWIVFRDKGISTREFVPGNPTFESTRKSLSPKCLHRRSIALHRPPLETISLADAPLCKAYLDSLRALGISPLVSYKWGNAVSAMLTTAQCEVLRTLRFVRAVEPVGHARLLSTNPITLTRNAVALHALHSSMEMPLSDSGCGYDPVIYAYGGSQSQLDRINVWPLHAMGFDGSGVRLGFLDVGFRWRENDAFQRLHVLSEYDYIQHDSVTENQPGDSSYQDAHGTSTLSTAMGYLPDTLMGPAFGAGVYLAKTEYVPTEHHIEEDNYAAALEDMEAAGVDITSSSLGYFTFDPPDTSYTYADMNGHTAICTQAVERAAKLGVLVVTAAGNSGADSAYDHIDAPADADSILAVGALDVDGSLAGFSSRGPTYDGRIKPDVCAPGVNIWAQAPDGTFGLDDGTSFATPLTSGACCLIKQAHPEATAQEIRHALMVTGANAAHPDTDYGWGEINAYAAALELGPVEHLFRLTVDSNIHVCVGVAANGGVASVTFEYYSSTDEAIRDAILPLAADSLIYSGTIQNIPLAGQVHYRITLRSNFGVTAAFPDSDWNELSLPFRLLSVILYPNDPAPIIRIDANTEGTWELFDQTGKPMLSGSIPNSNSFSIAGLSNGAYYFRFTATSGETKVLPIAVDH